MATDAGGAIAELQRISRELATNVRGDRLVDLARMNIDLIDRNLFERTADVRWWATDSSLVDALENPTPAGMAFATRRLGVILSAYTVYHDIVLANEHGEIVANGKPGTFQSVGGNVAKDPWFTASMATATGDDYGFQTAHRSELVGDRPVLVYSCGVRAGGEARGKLLGVLGVVFDWEDLSGGVISSTPIVEHERPLTDICIADGTGLVLAANTLRPLEDRLEIPGRDVLFRQTRGFVLGEIKGKPTVFAHAQAPGYQGYTTGWHSLIVQRIATD
jgi:hypothetical protein